MRTYITQQLPLNDQVEFFSTVFQINTSNAKVIFFNFPRFPDMHASL